MSMAKADHSFEENLKPNQKEQKPKRQKNLSHEQGHKDKAEDNLLAFLLFFSEAVRPLCCCLLAS